MDEMTLRDALELAVTTEEIGHKLYRRLAEKFAHEPAIADVFLTLAKDEGFHQEQFRRLGAELPRTSDEASRYGVSEYLRATAISEFFTDQAFHRTDEIGTVEDALRLAFNFEKTTALFYQALRDEIGQSEELDQLIAAEKSHVVALMKVLISDARFRGLGDAL